MAGGYVRAHRGLLVFVTALLFLPGLLTPTPLRSLLLPDAVAQTAEKKADEAEIQRLIQELGDEDWEVRRDAAKALGKIGDARAVEPLIQVLRKEAQAFKSLRYKGYERWKMLRNARRYGGGEGAATEPLIEAQVDYQVDYIDVCEAVAEALVKLGKPAVEPLIKVLGYKDQYVRRAAVEVLGEIRDARAVKPLIKVLLENWEMREAAAVALVKIGKPAVGPLKAIAYNRFKYEEGIKVEARQALQAIQSNVTSHEREKATQGYLHRLYVMSKSILKNHAGHFLFAGATAVIGILAVMWVFIAIAQFKHYRANKERKNHE